MTDKVKVGDTIQYVNCPWIIKAIRKDACDLVSEDGAAFVHDIKKVDIVKG